MEDQSARHRHEKDWAGEVPALRRELQSALMEKEKAEARVSELESELRRAGEQVEAARRQTDRIASRRIVRAALVAARPARPLFRLVRRIRRSGGRASSRPASRPEEGGQGFAAGIHAAAVLSALADRRPTTVLIPVCDALGALQQCVNSVLRNTPATTPILVIDDASTDPAMAAYLETLRGLANVCVLRNARHLGFDRTVTRGLSETDGDVIVLNSATAVTPRWLQNLTIAAYSTRDIGIATPLSNAYGLPASEMGDPRPNLEPDDLGRLVTQHSMRRYPETPMGHRLCTYVRRDMLDELDGVGDEAHRPRRGEGNDLLMRARGAGWHHVVDDATFVFHPVDESLELNDRGTEIGVASHVATDPSLPCTDEMHEPDAGPDLSAIRSNLAATLSTVISERTPPRPRVLYVLHEGDGGTPETNRDLMFAVENEVEPLLLTSTSRRLLLHRVSEGEVELIEEFDVGQRLTTSDTTNPRYRQFITSVLLRYAIELVHVRQLIKHTLDLPEIAAAMDIPVVLSFHDFYFVCPTVHLLDNEGRWCAGQCTPGDGVCAAPRTDPSIHLKHSWLHRWQDHVRDVFSHVDAFVATTPFTRDLYLRVYPELADKQFVVIEHGRDLEQHHGVNEIPAPGGPIRIAIVGHLARHKGSGFVRQIKAADHAGRIEFHLLGRTSDPDLGVVHGTYRREELPNRLADIAPHFIGLFSIWGETYSHTLTEAWACGVPVIASHLGALGERVSEHGGGWLVDPQDHSSAITTIYAAADDTDAYEQQANRANIDGLPSTADMAERYLKLYSSTLAAMMARTPTTT